MGKNRKEAIEQVHDKAAQEAKSLILEELASLQPFPEMEVGVEVDEKFGRCKYAKKVPGIVVRETLGPIGINIALAHYIVLTLDGACCFRGACFKKETYVGWWNFNKEFLPKEDSQFSPLSNAGYLEHHKGIFEAIEKAKEEMREK